MKKLKFIFLVGCFLAIGVISAVKLNVNYDDNSFLHINAEALANGESSGGGCYGVGSVVCDHGLYYGKYY